MSIFENRESFEISRISIFKFCRRADFSNLVTILTRPQQVQFCSFVEFSNFAGNILIFTLQIPIFKPNMALPPDFDPVPESSCSLSYECSTSNRFG